MAIQPPKPTIVPSHVFFGLILVRSVLPNACIGLAKLSHAALLIGQGRIWKQITLLETQVLEKAHHNLVSSNLINGISTSFYKTQRRKESKFCEDVWNIETDLLIYFLERSITSWYYSMYLCLKARFFFSFLIF